jgi:hypothetical protein
LDSIEKAHDVHEREKQVRPDERRFKGGGEGCKHYAHMTEENEISEDGDQFEDVADSAYDQA